MISIHSAGKIFGVTGWKVGWAIGPEAIISNMKATKVFTTFTSNTPAQKGVSESLEQGLLLYKDGLNYYEWTRQDYSRK